MCIRDSIGIMDLVPYLHTFALIPTAFLAMLKEMCIRDSIDGCQGLVDGLLHQSVNHGGDAQPALLAIVLRYLYSTDWVRTV